LNPFSDNDIQTFVKLGLSLSQARIYLTLISYGNANAKEISQATAIDPGEVYRQLDKLCDNGLVQKILNIPNKYEPINLKDTINMLVEQRNKENKQILIQIEEILEKKIGGPIEREVERILVSGSAITFNQIVKIYELLENELLWYTQIERVPMSVNSLYDSMKKALSRGVKWRVIAELNKPTKEIFAYIKDYQRKNSNFEIRFVNSKLNVIFGIQDGKSMSLYTEVPKMFTDSQLLITNNSQLVKIVKAYFEIIWQNASSKYPECELA
jgi:sugar-specific transcriptional regulator TrmB